MSGHAECVDGHLYPLLDAVCSDLAVLVPKGFFHRFVGAFCINRHLHTVHAVSHGSLGPDSVLIQLAAQGCGRLHRAVWSAPL